jgi:HAD superfamily hydrolase (TIGR01549 family)
VLDLDDTLIDHKAWILDKAERLAEAGAAEPALLRREALRLVEEGAAARLVEALIEALALRASRDVLIERYRAARPETCRVHDDVLPTLDTLRRRGYRLALLTDNPPESQRQKLEVSGLGAAFDAIVFAREAGAEKPAAAGFEAVARRLGLAPDVLAMAGDDPWRDVAGACGAGYGAAYLVRRSGGLRSFDERLFRGACPGLRYRVLDGLQGLLEFLPGRP